MLANKEQEGLPSLGSTAENQETVIYAQHPDPTSNEIPLPGVNFSQSDNSSSSQQAIMTNEPLLATYPREMILHILRYLKPTDLWQALQVTKSWYS
jgi:hypothetical protein